MATNQSVVKGLVAVRRLDGTLPGTIRCYIPATDETDTFVGDAVKVAGSSSTKNPGYSATVVQVAAGDAIFGVIQSIDQTTDIALGSRNEFRIYRPGDLGMYVDVVPATEDQLFEIQEDGVGATISADDIGLNANIIVGSGSTLTGHSGMQLDIESKNTTATLQLKIIEFVSALDNVIGVNAKLRVLINNRQLGTGTGTAGV